MVQVVNNYTDGIEKLLVFMPYRVIESFLYSRACTRGHLMARFVALILR